MKKTLLALALSVCCAAAASAQMNLIPNGDFSDSADPFKGWRVDFPYESWYVKNVTYVKVSPDKTDGVSKAIQIELPGAVAFNEGGKIESAFVKAEPGAGYRAEIDCLSNDFSLKLFAEAWALDPAPTDKPDKFRVPARNGMPGLVMCYRAQFPDPPATAKQWTTAKREFKIPAKVIVEGKEEQPAFLSLKAYVYSPVQSSAVGKAYLARFKLVKTN